MSNLRTLMFHDVVFEDQFNSSGFPGNDSAIYKLTQKQFSKFYRQKMEILKILKFSKIWKI